MNILEPLYEACLDRMQVFLDELETNPLLRGVQGCVYDANITIQSKAKRKGEAVKKQQHKGRNKTLDVFKRQTDGGI